MICGTPYCTCAASAVRWLSLSLASVVASELSGWLALGVASQLLRLRSRQCAGLHRLLHFWMPSALLCITTGMSVSCACDTSTVVCVALFDSCKISKISSNPQNFARSAHDPQDPLQNVQLARKTNSAGGTRTGRKQLKSQSIRGNNTKFDELAIHADEMDT